MTREILYQYLGTNGTILSPIHLEDIYYIRKVRLVAESSKMLTKDNKVFKNVVIVPEDEADEWFEVKGQG